MATISGSSTVNSPEKVDTVSSHQYTCNTCQVAFRFADTQKGHMKTDWHRYNLKRRVASLPPISSEVFSDKVLQARAATTAEADRAEFQQVCEVCQRTYYSENSYRNHVGSQKHKAKESALQRHSGTVDDDAASSLVSSTFSLSDSIPSGSTERGSDTETELNHVVESLSRTGLNKGSSPAKRPSNPRPPAEEPHGEDKSSTPKTHGQDAKGASASVANEATMPLRSCLFCNYESPTIPLSAVHMERIHSMFIPEKQYLVDLEGLIGALQKRIQKLHECLYCGKMKSNAFAVQTHMRDKGHCKIPFTSEEEQLEIGEYYDFRSTYSDDDEEESDEDESVGEGKRNGGAKLGARRTTKAAGEDGDEIIEDEDGWQTDSSASSCSSEDLKSIPIDYHQHQYERLDKHPHHSSYDPRHHHQKDGWHSHAHKHRAVFYDDTELHLPSGRAVGHRSMAKYYRQNLHHYPSAAERIQRLELEAASDDHAMDVDADENNTVAAAPHTERGRRQNGAVVARAKGSAGMLGVTDAKKKEVRRAEQRAQKHGHNAEKRKTWLVNRQANHQKYYNPQIL